MAPISLFTCIMETRMVCSVTASSNSSSEIIPFSTAKKKIAKTLRVSEKEIIFTSGGTESNNLAIIGAAMANRRAGNHIITTSIEHASVENPMEFLKEQGFEITYLSVDTLNVFAIFFFAVSTNRSASIPFI